jgi:PAS domain S-box-containing protein/putative nucleotidyltransferase with HDIG domain
MFPKKPQILRAFRKHYLLPWLALVAGLAATLYLSHVAQDNIETTVQRQFELDRNRIASRIETLLQSHRQVLLGGAALFNASQKVSRDQWHSYVNRLALDQHFKGIQGMGFWLLVSKQQLPSHIAKIRKEGFPEYTVWPAGERDFYAPVVYLEPFNGTNLRAFGYDALSEPVRHAALEQARDTANTSLSGKVKLVQETGKDVQAGALMLVPVYRTNLPIKTVEQRRTALVGWVYSPFRMTDLLQPIMEGEESRSKDHVHLKVYDGVSESPLNLLYDSDPLETPSQDVTPINEIITFNEHKWTLSFSNHYIKTPVIRYNDVWATIASGSIVSLLLSLLLLSYRNTQRKAQLIANNLTQEIRDRAESELEHYQQSKQYQAIVNSSNDAIVSTTIEGIITSWNPAAEAIFGFSADEMIGKPKQSLIPLDCQDEEGFIFKRLIRGEQIERYETRRIRKYGQVIEVLMTISLIQDSNGNTLGASTIASDITERKKAERKLRASELRFRGMIQNAFDLTILLDIQGVILFISPSIKQIAGYEASEIQDRKFQEFIHPDDLQKAQADLSWLIQNPKLKVSTENRFRSKNGSWLILESISSNLLDVPELNGIIVNIREITNRKRDEMLLHRLSSFYKALSLCNEAIVRSSSDSQLYQKVCDIVTQHSGMNMAWIGLKDDSSKKVKIVAVSGEGREYLEGIDISFDPENPHSHGQSGTAILKQQPCWIQDFTTDTRTTLWQERAKPFGWHSSASLPIFRNGKVVGTLTMYSTEISVFDDTIRDLLIQMSNNISFALDNFEHEVRRKENEGHLIESEARFRILVEQSLAGAFIIQDNKIIYANPRLNEILGYIADDGLTGQNPFEIVAKKDHATLKKQVKEWISSKQEYFKSVFTALRKDGTEVEAGVNMSIANYHGHSAFIGLIQDISERRVAEGQIKRYHDQLQNSFLQTVELATTLGEMRDPYTAGHERRVSSIAIAIGTEMGLDKFQLEGLRVGGYLHDVGKTIIPIEILAKPGKLSQHEFELIKEHPQAGFNVLKGVEFPWPVAQIALQHHERMDGSGYPQGLKGEGIIFEARIMAVADVIEAMSSHRPYRPGLGIEAALEEIKLYRGVRFDKNVVDACLKLFVEKGYKLPL